MKNFLFLLAVFFTVITAEAQPGGDSTISRINQVIDRWHRDAAESNHKAYIGAMTSDGVFVGTDATEYWTTAEFSAWSKPHFDRKKTWNFKPVSRNTYVDGKGTTAWFDELLDTQMGLCRGSGVLLQQDGIWKIAQYVLSPTIPNDIMKKVTSMKSATDSMLVYKHIFDKYGLTGTLLILDPEKNSYCGYNQALWDSGYLPASTFKIPNTLIGLETGVIDSNYIFRWKGEKRRLPQWEQDLSLRAAFRVSCVPCYQQLARKTGPERMISWLEKLNYPGMDVHRENIDLFWLEGKSRITPRQQAAFIRQLYEEKLPLSATTMKTMKAIMLQEEAPGYKISGKTGWAIRNGNNYGWFVGYLEAKGKVYFVATLVEPKNQEKVDDFAIARKLVTMDAFRFLGLIP
jgi:beta-lactamase class D